MWGFVKEWKWKGPFSHGNHSCGVWLLLLAAQSVSCGLRKAPSSFSDTEMSQDICSNWHPIGIPTERATEQPREASPLQSSLIYNVSLCMKKVWSLWSTVLGWHSFKMQLFWFQALSMYESGLKFNLCYDTAQHTQCPINLCKTNTKISLFFPSLFCLYTLVFQWWHYHITEKCLALQAWVNSVFHVLIKLLGIFTQSLGMSPFQITSKF